MFQRVLKLLLWLLCIKIKDFSEASRKFVHQRDISEHCKRRVVPSVFLGQHVTDAHSQILQFSQLEIPYSCSLSVRAEAGSNIILIVELQSEDSLIEACSLSGEQLVVYELGETFGGYWGPIPDVIMKESVKNYTQFYTLKTTRQPKTRTLPQPTRAKIVQQTVTQSTVKEQEYYTIDVPIVNVSGNFKLGPRRETNDSEDLFNYIYDVTPRNGVEYETSIMPLVQFSVRQQSNGYGGGERRYELDYDTKGFTMDPRLIFNTAKKKKSFFKKDWNANRRFRPRGKSTALFRRRDSKKMYTVRSSYDNKEVTSSIPTLESSYFTNSWELIDGIIKSIKATTFKSTVFKSETFRNILDKMYNSQQNSSVYLAPNISLYDVDISINENETTLQNETDSNQFAGIYNNMEDIKELGMPTTSLLLSEQNSSQEAVDLRSINEEMKANITDIHEITSLDGIQTDEITMTTDKLNAQNELLTEFTTVRSTTTIKSVKSSFLTGEMVDHESWENIVQAAPVMAVVLNNTEPLINNTITEVFNKRKHKRHINSLEIDQSRPRNLTTKRYVVPEVSQFEELQDLARLLELQDDEIGSRVALRYLRHYVGPAMYNLCDQREHSLRQMFLFNSSRIVIAVSNFTLDRMMLVLTPAQTLQSGVSQCPDGQLECQIIGTRVCIDSLNACDGVPNCGSYEIYDEERLTCGTAHGMQHSVYLAALTFLAVILTAAYIILYWLERCVPRVSDAFFVYSDSTENELLLDSVMRSPNEDEDNSYKINYLGNFFEDDGLYQDLKDEVRNVHYCKKIFNACCKIFGFRKTSTEKPSEKVIVEHQLPTKELPRIFSFTQSELKKFGKVEFRDKEVQTGDSFEMQELNIQKNKLEKSSLSSLIRFKAYQNDTRRKDSELNLLKFSKESKSSSSQNDSTSFDNPKSMVNRYDVGTGTDREIEIENFLYENLSKPRNTIPVTCEVHTENKKVGESSKRLRFDDDPQMIPNVVEDEPSWLTTSSAVRQLNSSDDLDKIVQVQGTEVSSKDLSRFWGAKGKKSKKKKLKYLS